MPRKSHYLGITIIIEIICYNYWFFKQGAVLQIIAHRGFWEQEQDKNSYFAFQKSFTNGFGVDTDLRDFTIKNPPPPHPERNCYLTRHSHN